MRWSRCKSNATRHGHGQAAGESSPRQARDRVFWSRGAAVHDFIKDFTTAEQPLPGNALQFVFVMPVTARRRPAAAVVVAELEPVSHRLGPVTIDAQDAVGNEVPQT